MNVNAVSSVHTTSVKQAYSASFSERPDLGKQDFLCVI